MKLSILTTCLLVTYIQARDLSNSIGYDYQENLSSKGLKSEFEGFKLLHGKFYEDEAENSKRFQLFMRRRQDIELHNQQYANGSVSYKLKMNKFGDRSDEELNDLLSGFRYSEFGTDACTFLPPYHVHLRDVVDWRKLGAVTPVKDQGYCGSCWAFSTIGALEAQQFRKTGQLVTLSEQNLVDCTEEYGNSGCNGGYMYRAFRYILRNRGVDTNKSYPYEGTDNQCRYKSENKGAKIAGYCTIKSGDEEHLKSAVATVGPVAIAIHVSQDLMFYEKGVYYKEKCPSKFRQLNHAVLAVGYGSTHDNEDYWLIKNSWGEDYGKKGYMLMARNKDNNCGIATHASYPLV